MTSRWCPSCRRRWPTERPVCPACLTGLVDDLEATVRCRHCGRDWPARMQSCPECLAELRPDPEALAEAQARTLIAGGRLPRPAGVPPFAQGPDCSLFRMAPRSPLLYAGPDELLEASVDGRDHRAVPPLRCLDLDGSLLFRLERYEAADRALVAIGADGAPLGTFLRWATATDAGLDVRDETSAPAARLRPTRGGDSDYELVETGGGTLATCVRTDLDFDDWVDDQWWLRAGVRLPIPRLAAVALVLATKVLLGRPSPVPVREAARLDEGDGLEDRPDLWWW